MKTNLLLLLGLFTSQLLIGQTRNATTVLFPSGDETIEGIGIDSGFRSRSAMYTAFKKKTGKSPGHFR